jgi:hypothetical protein
MINRFGKPNQFPEAALVSFPCSGNTWLRQLLEHSSGFFTGSIYRDSVLETSGYYGEKAGIQDGTTILTKTHEYSESHIMKFLDPETNSTKAVLLIRNPYKAILSFHNFLFGGHIGSAPVINYFRKGEHLFFYQ